jgi:type III restriction enzyme
MSEMALHPSFPADPHAVLDPAVRCFPADEARRASSFEKLLPPLVPELRKQVKQWRDSGYAKATETSRSLLNWWFKTPHLQTLTPGPSPLSGRGEAMTEFQYLGSMSARLIVTQSSKTMAAPG